MYACLNSPPKFGVVKILLETPDQLGLAHPRLAQLTRARHNLKLLVSHNGCLLPKKRPKMNKCFSHTHKLTHTHTSLKERCAACPILRPLCGSSLDSYPNTSACLRTPASCAPTGPGSPYPSARRPGERLGSAFRRSNRPLVPPTK